MSLKNALNDMKKKLNDGNFKASDKKSYTNKAAVVLNNQTPTKNKIKSTAEQIEIIESNADSMSIGAFSGTGKTTVLVGYAQARTKSKGLYIAFNKSIKEEAARKFPSHVKCVTSHGLAFSKYGFPLQHKLMGYTNWKDVYDKTTIQSPFGDSALYNRVYASLLQDTINRFTNTDADTIREEHIYNESYAYLKRNRTLASYLPDDDIIVSDAMKLWMAVINPEIVEIRATHDTYLKLYQLSQPVLKYDYVLLDEAQDSNPALLDIFDKQKCGKILVGDPYQSIYGFRNAIDAMSKIKTDKYYNLTMSFRFGQQIANFANSVLALRGETKQLIGMKEKDLVYYGKPLEEKGNSAFIGRYNSTLLRDVIEYLDVKNSQVYFAGGFDSLKPNLLLDLYNLRSGRGFIKDVMLSTFKNYEDFKEVITETDDKEWLGRSRLVEEYGGRLPSLIENIKKKETKNPDLAGKIYSTAHKSKGLEFDHVILAGDYYATPMDEAKVPANLFTKPYDPLNEELHIFYVAATRAKRTLNVPENYRDYYLDFGKMVEPKLLDYNQKNKVYPLLDNNKKFIKTLMAERQKTADFYLKLAAERKAEQAVKSNNDIDDIFE